MSLLPHTTQPITTEPASYEMRGWMEGVNDSLASLEILIAAVGQYNSITVTGPYTASNLDFINAKSRAVITLPANPIENSVIIVRNGDGSTITVNPNGKTLNGETIGYIRSKGTALVIHYFIDSDEWLVR